MAWKTKELQHFNSKVKVAITHIHILTKSCLGGLFGSTLGLLVGIGFGSGHILPLIWTQIEGGNSSPCSAEGSSGQNLSWTCRRVELGLMADGELNIRFSEHISGR